jgi:hypothetical protein
MEELNRRIVMKVANLLQNAVLRVSQAYAEIIAEELHEHPEGNLKLFLLQIQNSKYIV